MSRDSISPDDIAAYARAHSTAPDAVQRELIEATTERTGRASIMQIGVDQGAFMSVLAATLRPRFAVEVGTVLRRLAPDGLILVDNTLWSGMVLPDSGADDADTIALQEFNDFVVDDERVESALLTIGDGVTIIRRAR